MWYFSITGLINGLTSIILGIFVYFINRKPLANKLFILFCLSASIWGFSYFFWQISHDAATALFWSRALMAGAILIPIFYLHFTLVFLSLARKYKVLLIVLYIFFIFCEIINFTPYFVSNVQPELIFPFWPQPGIFYHIFLLVWFFIWISATYVLLQNYRMSIGAKKNQILYLLMGVAVGFIGGSTNFLLWYGIPILPYGNILVSFYVATTFYAILAHHLFDIRVIIKKTLVYSGLLAFVLITYSIIVLSISIVLSGEVSVLGASGVLTWKMFLPNLFAAILIAIGFDPLKNWLSHITDKWLFKGEYNQQAVLSKLSDNLSTVIDINEALASMMGTITEAMRIKNAAVFVLRKKIEGVKNNKDSADHSLEIKNIKVIGFSADEQKLGDKCQPIIRYFEKPSANKILITEELERSGGNKDFQDTPVLICLKELKIAFAAPITLGENPKDSANARQKDAGNQKLIGIFVLGEKLSGDVFSEKDMNLLEITVKQTAAAIEKARFYEEDQLKSEFVSIASHELLTPTSAIEGYLSMILDEHLAKVDKKAEGYLQKVYASSKRLAALVKDLLNVSRIEGGRIIIQWQAFDIVKLINNVLDELAPKAKEKKLKFDFVSGSAFDSSRPSHPILSPDKSGSVNRHSAESKSLVSKSIWVFADEERAHQVLVNLIGNAIKYTEHGEITVQITRNPSKILGASRIQNTKKIQSSPLNADQRIAENVQNNEITISVIDTGMGMSDEDQKHLFEKFYRASNATSSAIGGTGLGLYISKNIAELMGGRIWLKSALDKGSTFYFSLKLATPDQIKNYSKKPDGPSYMSMKK